MIFKRGLVRTSLGHIHYREVGEGPAIVLLHINQQSSEIFLEMMAALAPAMRAIAIDYPSHGGSDHLAEQPSIADYASCVREALLDEMMHKLRPADASGYPKLRTLEFMLEQDPDHAPLQPTQSWMDRINRAQIEAGRDRWQALIALTRYDLATGLERLGCPALLLMGEHFYFGHRVGEIRSRVKDLRYEVLQGARFCACWEKAGEIAALLIKTLK